MRVGIVGGVDRAESLYARVAHKAGHEIEFHDGATRVMDAFRSTSH